MGVINRSQADIKSGTPIRESLKKEAKFFLSHPSYRSMAHRLGTPFLSKMLNTILMNHIRDCLPDIKNAISSELIRTQKELDELGKDTFPLMSG